MTKPTLRGLFLIDSALSTELVTALLPTGEDSTLTDIDESVSNEGNTQFHETMDTDQRQTLIGINQGKDLERLTSDVMNQKVSPNALAGTCQTGQHIGVSQEHVKVDLRTARLWLQCMDYIEVMEDFIIIMLRETGNVRWTSESRHRIIESFRSDMSYSLCQVCSPLCPGNPQVC